MELWDEKMLRANRTRRNRLDFSQLVSKRSGIIGLLREFMYNGGRRELERGALDHIPSPDQKPFGIS